MYVKCKRLALTAHYGAIYFHWIFATLPRALALSILDLNQSALAGCWRCVAGAFDGAGRVILEANQSALAGSVATWRRQ
jgi:hypothetical protein